MPDSTIEMVTRRKIEIQPYIDQWIANKKERSKGIDSKIDYLSAIAVRIGEPTVDMLLEKYTQIAEQNARAWNEH